MKLEVYCLYDSAIEDYGRPLYAHNDADVIRMCVLSMRNPDSLLSQFPDNFRLYHIGTWVSDTGVFLELSPRLIDLPMLRSAQQQKGGSNEGSVKIDAQGDLFGDSRGSEGGTTRVSTGNEDGNTRLDKGGTR